MTSKQTSDVVTTLSSEDLTIDAAGKTLVSHCGEPVRAIDKVSIEVQPGECFIMLSP